MEPTPPSPPSAPPGSPSLNEVGALRALFQAIRSRVVSGLVLALPIVLTFWILYWIYATLKAYALDPLANTINSVLRAQGYSPLEGTGYQVLAFLVAVLLVLTFLYVLGLFVRSRMLRAVDWVLRGVPVVTTIYKALSNVVQSLGNQVQNQKFQRVVLVDFPHHGSRALAFVTNSLRDEKSGRTILCVCVLTGVVPPAGFTLFVPEESVTDVKWTVNQALQVILSGGITAPGTINYSAGRAAPAHLVDVHDRPLSHPLDATSPEPSRG